MRFSARIFGVVLLLAVFLVRLTPFAFAQTTNPYSSLMKTDATTPVNISTIAQGALVGILSTLTCAVAGVDFTTKNNQCLSFNPKTQTFGYAPTTRGGGLIGMELSGIAFTYQNPIHVGDYFQYLSSDFGLVKTAHAANGIGFDQLTPIMSLWIAFRNLSYLLFVLVFVVIGFAVMLRAKIDPRTVMTIENQIPKLIIALILITFSYAIAGFAIDVMWVGVYFIINIFAGLDPQLTKQVGALTAQATSNPYGWANALYPIGGFMGIAFQAATGVGQLSNTIMAGIFSTNFIQPFVDIFVLLTNPGGFVFCAVKSVVPGQPSVNDCINPMLALIPSFIAGLTAFLIFAVALIVAIAKLWWQLIKAYVLFLIFAIFGPIIIMSGVIPGSKTNFEYWLRHILAYTIVFPTAMGVFLLGKTLMDIYSSVSTNNLPLPPLIGIPGNAYAFFGPLLGFAVIMLAPQSLTMVQDALNAQDPKYLAGIGQAIGAGGQWMGSMGGFAWKRYTREADPIKKLEEGGLRRLVLGNRAHPTFLRTLVEGKRMQGNP